MSKILYAVNEYGEIIEGGIYITPKESQRDEEIRKQRREYFERKKQEELLKIDFTEILGSFYFVNYKKLLKIIDDDTATGFRYLYLCTFADDSGRLIYEDDLVTHKLFRRIFRFNDAHTTSKVVDKIESLGLLHHDENGCYHINLDYYVRNTKLPEEFKGNSSRMLDIGIRRLYEMSTPKHHAMLGKIIPLLEYLNKNYNILCSKETVYETDVACISPLTPKEICEICGRSPENYNRFINELGKFIINRRPFVRRVVDDTEEYELNCYFVNPYIVYMGNKNNYLEFTFKLFDLGRNCVRNRYKKRRKLTQ